jgi:pimeloyl-ACP methyl ester carboxylesterase
MPRLERDGVGLWYEQAGAGDRALVFVHGWMCDSTHFAPQMAHFAGLGRSIAVDLRGHGRSDKPHQDYTPEAFADDLAWLCQQLNLHRPVFVGHSMGGVVAYALAARNPELCRAVVAFDAPLCLTAGHHAALSRAVERFHGPDYHERVRRFLDNMFLADADHLRKERIIEGILAGPEHVGLSAFDCMLASPFALADSAPHIGVPMLAIASSGGHMATLERLKELSPQLATGQVVGAGHFLQLEVPEQVNPMLERFLTLTDAD